MPAVIGLIVLCGLWHLWWLHRFRAGFPLDIDESRYVQFGLALKDELAASGPRGMWHVWAAQHDFGPLLPLTSVPIYFALGESLSVALATQIGFLALLLLASYGIGTRLSSRTGGALVALAVAATPGVIDFTRSYQYALTAAAVVAAATYALLASETLTRRGWALIWGLLLGLMPLARTMLVAFAPAQVIAAGVLVFGRPGDRRPRVVNLMLSFAVGVAAASLWFATSFHTVANYLTNFGFGAKSAGFAASRSRLTLGYWTRELVNTVKAELYLPFAVLLALAFVIGVVALVVRARTSRVAARERARNWGTSDAAVTLLITLEAYLAVTATKNEGVGFRLPVIPGLMALAVAAIWVLRRPLLRAGLVTALILVSGLNLLSKSDVIASLSRTRLADVPSLGSTPVLLGTGYIQGYVLGSFESSSPSSTKPLPDSQKGWLPAYERIVVRIRRMAGREGPATRVRLATQEPLLNSFDLALAARLHFHESLRVTPLGFEHGPVTTASYRQLLAGGGPSALVTVSRLGLNYVARTGGVAVDQATITRTARAAGFRLAGSVRLPDTRAAFIWWRPR